MKFILVDHDGVTFNSWITNSRVTNAGPSVRSNPFERPRASVPLGRLGWVSKTPKSATLLPGVQLWRHGELAEGGHSLWRSSASAKYACQVVRFFFLGLWLWPYIIPNRALSEVRNWRSKTLSRAAPRLCRSLKHPLENNQGQSSANLNLALGKNPYLRERERETVLLQI